MFKEHSTLDYACRVIKVLSSQSGPMPAGDIAQSIGASSHSYICKVLSRMTRARLLSSGVEGYTLMRSLAQLTIGDVLDLCRPRQNTGQGHADKIATTLLGAARQVPLSGVL